jgi:hypothetical protein
MVLTQRLLQAKIRLNLELAKAIKSFFFSYLLVFLCGVRTPDARPE